MKVNFSGTLFSKNITIKSTNSDRFIPDGYFKFVVIRHYYGKCFRNNCVLRSREKFTSNISTST